MVGSGFGSLAGGAISENLGGSYELGANIGSIVGGVVGSAAYSKISSTINTSKAVKNAKIDYRLRENQLYNNGERIATTKQVRSFKKEMMKKNVKVVVDKKERVLGWDKAAGFCAEENTIYIRKKPALVDMYHESFHAEQCSILGLDKYKALSTFEKESYAVNRIRTSGLFNVAEVATNEKYLQTILR